MIYILGFIGVLFALKLCWNIVLPFGGLKSEDWNTSPMPIIELFLLTLLCVIGWLSSVRFEVMGVSSWGAFFGIGFGLIILSYLMMVPVALILGSYVKLRDKFSKK